MNFIDELALEQCIFELRYNPAYLLWDRVGSIWSAMIAANPSLKASTVQASQQVFETETLKISLELSVLRVSGRGADAVDDVVKNAGRLIKCVCARIKIDSFTRAGFRMIRLKAFERSADAMRFAKMPNEGVTVLGEGNRKVGVVNSMRYESEKAGIQATLRVEEREVSFQVPWESLPFLPVKRKMNDYVLVLDSDYYTIGTVEQESFDAETWIRQASKTIQAQWSSI